MSRHTMIAGLIMTLGSALACGDTLPVDATPGAGGSAAGLSWYRDVLPVAQKHCLGCHVDDGLSFSMATFSDEVTDRADLMAQFTAQGTMPPWQPSSDCNSYHGERILSDADKAIFAEWAAGGAVEGDPADAPDAPPLAADLAWIDRSLTMAEPYTPANTSDGNDHRCFVLDPEITEDVHFIGYKVNPGEKQVVHHALFYVADAAELEKLDADDPGPGYECPGGPNVASAQVIAGWVPGTPAYSFPADTGIRLKVGQKIAMQIHYNTVSSGPLPDQTSVDLQFAKQPVKYEATLTSMADHSFAIPPASTGYTTETRLTVPATATVWAAAPHMHLMGRQTRVDVERQAGGSDCVIDIPKWDFDWQQFYFLDDPKGMQLEKGDDIVFSCTWDNIGDQTVKWGNGTDDEMCIAYFYVTAGHVE
jgi:hypothetical protein